MTSCTGSALHFGDLDDPASEVSQLVAEAGEHAYTLAREGNEPVNVYILHKMKWRS